MSAKPNFRRHPIHKIISLLCFLSLISLSKPTTELQSLLNFKTSLSKSPTDAFATWVPDQNPLCNFTGITCNPNQMVTEINLSQQNLSGTLPFDSICSLQSLEKISLGSNTLFGSITEEVSNCTNLKYLDLGWNSFVGKVPDLSSLTQLKYLNLNRSGFSGQFPWKSLENLTNLEFLSLGDNPFDKNPFPLENKFTGGIPENYVNCSSLHRFRVNNNSLSGIVPAGIWSLPNLSIVDLTWNQFEGPLGSTIGEAKALAQLFLAHNRFSGELPATIGEATSLVDIELSSNRFSGVVPATIRNLKMLSKLHLENNLFSGTIPESLGSCVSLSDISLAGNLFSGEIPASIGSLRSLNSLNLSDNKLSGEIPMSLSSLRLSLLDLSNNQLMGRIPESLSIEAYRSSFAGNLGLCSENLVNFRSCSSDSGKSSNFRTVISCFVAGASVLFLSILCFIYVKGKPKGFDHPIKRRSSWDMKQFHVLSFSEEEVVNAIRKENLIGKGGSGNVYMVRLRNGKQLAVKHIWKSDSGDRRSCRSSSSMLAKGSLWSPEFDAEVVTLSSIRHVNVVKLYCSITSEDSNLLRASFGGLDDFRGPERRRGKGADNRDALHDEDSGPQTFNEDGGADAGRGRALRIDRDNCE
ncbi:hypothetical protein C3L33_21067, partial [Rhododendron williamsianum]